MEESTDNEELLVHVGNLLHTTEGLKKSMEALVKGVAESLGGEQEGVSQETWTSFGRPMDEERLEPDVLEEEPMVSSAALEAQILGLDLPLNWPELIPEALFRQLKSELYSKDNSMKLSDALNFNIYGSSVLKGFNTVDVEESIKYFRETYDLDLREPGKNVVTIENIELKPADMFRLVPMVFLNDSTINYYLKVIQKYILSPAQTSECHFFNTYFFSKIRQEVANICMQQDVMLLSKHRAQLQTQMDPVNKKMRGWYKRIKLFQKKYLLLPVNKKDHWFAVVVANLPSLLQHFTQDLDLSTLPAELRPAILLLDPLVNVEESLELILRLFLETELKETLGPTYELKILQKEDPQDPDKSFLITDKNLPAYQLIIPRQKNTYDCGVFALEYMESFALNPQFILGRLGQNKHFPDWFPKSLIENKRKQIISFIINHSRGMDMEANVQELMRQRKSILEEKKDDPDEFDIVNPEEVSKYLLSESPDQPMSEEDRSRMFIRTYYNILPKEITTLCQMYFEHNFSTK